MTRLVYGGGEWGPAAYSALRQIFYAIFLTDVVGLEPRYAAFAALTSLMWDAFNDPLVGYLSDRVRTRWGRRRPFLLAFSVPFCFAFLLLWWAPPWESQVALAVHVTLAFVLADALHTLVAVPYQAMTPSMTSDYDERTSLSGYRMFFNLLASLAAAVAGPAIVDATVSSGGTLRQGYLMAAAAFGASAAPATLLVFLVARERVAPAGAGEPLLRSLRAAWANAPLRSAICLYAFNWASLDLVALMLPFYLTYWVSGGDMLAKIDLLGASLPLESAVLGTILLVAAAAVPAGALLARARGKRFAFISGLALWTGVQGALLLVQPGQTGAVLALAATAGLCASIAHVLPDAIFPDVVEWDELRTGHRREGLYYGIKNFSRKVSGAVSIFVALQVLGVFGYARPPAGALRFEQPAEALFGIRILTGPVVMALLLAAIAAAAAYPLTRERHARVRALLERRAARGRRRAPA